MVTTSWRARTELAAGYDADLRSERLKAYRELWKRLERLASNPPPGPVTGPVLDEIALELREWYFQQGGIFMSRPSQRAYVKLQEGIGASSSQTTRSTDGVLAEREIETIRKLASVLRTWTTRDVLTRRGSLLTSQRFSR